jgi:beta-lactamase class A
MAGRILLFLVLLALVGAQSVRMPVRSQVPAKASGSLAKLEAELSRVASLQWGKAGASILHVESGQWVEIAGSERFPMASTVKVAIALELMKRVEEGAESLDRMVTIRESDLRPGSGILTEYFPKAGLAMTLRNLMELMMLDSDNSATDLVLREVGGAPVVRKRLKEWGIEGMDVSRPILNLLADLSGNRGFQPGDQFRLADYEAAANRLSADQRTAAGRAFYADSRDTSTPRAMATLLQQLIQGKLLNPDNTRSMVEMMERCRTGNSRLKGILPKETAVAHKTGSFALVANDVGIITLPGTAGHLVIAAFVKGTTGPEKDRAIAEIARAAHDYFVFFGE